MRLVKPSATLLNITSGAAQHIERCGRVCYKSEDNITDDSAATFIRMAIKCGHLSVLEHASATIHFVCDRGVSHEIVRHRIASYSQESTRYCDYGEGNVAFIEPPGLEDPSDLTDWQTAMNMAGTRYFDLRQNGVPPQIARSVLPNSLKTEIIMTANFREWLHFFSLRCSAKAHPQMREVADAARGLLCTYCPEVFKGGI